MLRRRVLIGRTARLGLALAVLALAAACAGPAPASQEPAAGDPARLYQQACAKCHGVDGSGGLPMSAGGPRPTDLRDTTWQASRTDAEIAAAITDGRGAMPPFRDVLDRDAIAALTRYVRGLGNTSSP